MGDSPLESSPPEPSPPELPARDRRRTQHSSAGTPWQPWLAYLFGTGVLSGILWWLLAPGGAFYGEGTDYHVWFPRDAVLAGLLLVGGIASAVLALRGTFLPRRSRPAAADPAREKPSRALFAALVVGGFAASVIAWRTGVFAGDLFQTPPENMASPSMVFSLRSPSVLLLWPLATTAVIFFRQLIAYSFTSPADETMQVPKPHNG